MKPKKIKANKPNGFRDRTADEQEFEEHIMVIVQKIYFANGFEQLETPMLEYSDALGKSMADTGVFTFDDGDRGLSLRYDLTAPLARYVAENYQHLPKPFRSCRSGYVFRNERPKPGRYRQFLQIDADTVGASGILADAEMCRMMLEVFRAMQLPVRIRINHRQLLDTLFYKHSIEESLIPDVMRSIDKVDRLGIDAVKDLLGNGRQDDSGAFVKGVGLDQGQIEEIMLFLQAKGDDNRQTLANLDEMCDLALSDGYADLYDMLELLDNPPEVVVDPSVVRGMDYYTGAVYEAEIIDADTGSIAGGGRYDQLLGRFMGQNVPCAGMSIGVSRLAEAMNALGKCLPESKPMGPVVVCIMERDCLKEYFQLAEQLRTAGIRAETYQGNSKNFGKQLEYADRRNSPCAIIRGRNEMDAGTVQIKDLELGRELSKNVTDNEQWRSERPGQFEVPLSEMVSKVREIIEKFGREKGDEQ